MFTQPQNNRLKRRHKCKKGRTNKNHEQRVKVVGVWYNFTSAVEKDGEVVVQIFTRLS